MRTRVYVLGGKINLVVVMPNDWSCATTYVDEYKWDLLFVPHPDSGHLPELYTLRSVGSIALVEATEEKQVLVTPAGFLPFESSHTIQEFVMFVYTEDGPRLYVDIKP